MYKVMVINIVTILIFCLFYNRQWRIRTTLSGSDVLVIDRQLRTIVPELVAVFYIGTDIFSFWPEVMAFVF
jgi:hypothetical protein